VSKSHVDDHAWPFVGREDELARFRRMLVDAGSRGLVLAGASGVGKTRTGTECLAIASGEAELPLRALAHLLRAALSQALNLTSPWEGVHRLVKTN
jgi:hypothetical protein